MTLRIDIGACSQNQWPNSGAKLCYLECSFESSFAYFSIEFGREVFKGALKGAFKGAIFLLRNGPPAFLPALYSYGLSGA